MEDPMHTGAMDENLFNVHLPLATSSDPINLSNPLPIHAGEDIPYLEPSSPSAPLVPPENFTPFFTLIAHPETGEYQHPTVHYIFSDDEDHELLTSAVLASLDVDPSDTEGEERVIIADMAADGKTVTSLESLSENFQALRHTVAPAPSWGDEGRAPEERGLMLTVSGRGRSAGAGLTGSGQRKGRKAEENLESMVKAFGERLAGLNEVLRGSEDGTDAVEGT